MSSRFIYEQAEQVKNSSKGANCSEEMHYMLKKTPQAAGTSIRYVRNLVAKQQHLARSVCELRGGNVIFSVCIYQAPFHMP